MNTLIKKLIGNILYITNTRFHKKHRATNTVLYRLIDTTECNQRAEYKKLGLDWAL